MNDFRHHRHGHWLGTILFTVVLLGLIALAIGDSSPGIAVGALVSVAILATALHYLLPGGGFFSAVFANLVGIYACLYVFFISVNFGRISALAAQVG